MSGGPLRGTALAVPATRQTTRWLGLPGSNRGHLGYQPSPLTNWVGASHATVTPETYIFGVGAATRTRTVLRLATLAGW